jgi:DNA-binding MarR family transcriptional regulator
MAARSSKLTDPTAAFLLSQLGHRAASLFAELLIPLDLTPPLAGMLRLIAGRPGLSQQEISTTLALLPSRVVAFVDDLQSRGYVTRERSQTDRRVYALHLTAQGQDLMGQLAEVAREHDRQITAGLSSSQKTDLKGILLVMAEQNDLIPGVHPGFRAALPGDGRQDP